MDQILEAVWRLDLRAPVVASNGSDPLGHTLGRLTGWPTFDMDGGRIDPGALVAAADRARRAPVGGGRLRVVFVDHCALASGAELALARMLPAFRGVDGSVILAEEGPLSDLLRAQGCDVRIEAMDPRTRQLRKDTVVPGLTLLQPVMSAGRYALHLARIIRHMQPDLVVTNSLKSALYGALAARLAGVPSVWHLRDRIAEDYLPRPAVIGVRIVARFLPSGIVANSEATLGTLRLSRSSMVRLFAQAIGSPCDIGSGTPVEPPPGDVRIGMIGRLAPWKSQDLFIRAFARAFPSPGVCAVVVGDALFGEDRYAASLRDLVESLGMSGRVEFTGHVDDVRAQLDQLHIAVHASSVPEPFGQVVVEAMAAGRPVVASGEGGPAEIVEDGVDGLLFAPGDEEALATQLRRLVEDPTLRRRLGTEAAIRAARFAPEVVADEVETAYRLVVARRGMRHESWTSMLRT